MKIAELLRPPLIFPALRGRTKTDILRELSLQIAKAVPTIHATDIEHALVARETLGSTGTEDGCAFPHARIPALATPTLAFGRTPCGVPFGAADQQQTDLFFVLLAPEGAVELPLTVLALLARLLRHPELRTELRSAPSPTAVLAILARWEST